MKSFDKFLKDAKLPDLRNLEAQKTTWYFYHKGVLVEAVDVLNKDRVKELKKQYPAQEFVTEQNPAYMALVTEYNAKYDALTELWHADLRAEYDHLNDEVFNACYSEAYDRGHSSGYDEVANCMIDVVYFAEKIIAAIK